MTHYVKNHLQVYAPDEETMDQFWRSSAFSDNPARVLNITNLNIEDGLLSRHFFFRTDSEPPTDEFLRLADCIKDVGDVFFIASWQKIDDDDQVLDSGMMASFEFPEEH